MNSGTESEHIHTYMFYNKRNEMDGMDIHGAPKSNLLYGIVHCRIQDFENEDYGGATVPDTDRERPENKDQSMYRKRK